MKISYSRGLMLTYISRAFMSFLCVFACTCFIYCWLNDLLTWHQIEEIRMPSNSDEYSFFCHPWNPRIDRVGKTKAIRPFLVYQRIYRNRCGYFVNHRRSEPRNTICYGAVCGNSDIYSVLCRECERLFYLFSHTKDSAAIKSLFWYIASTQRVHLLTQMVKHYPGEFRRRTTSLGGLNACA